MTDPAIPQEFQQRPVTLDGRTQTVAEWCEERKLSVALVYNRRKNMSWAEALTAGSLKKANQDRLRNTTWNARRRA